MASHSKHRTISIVTLITWVDASGDTYSTRTFSN